MTVYSIVLKRRRKEKLVPGNRSDCSSVLRDDTEAHDMARTDVGR
jgi:hypothetical protein